MKFVTTILPSLLAGGLFLGSSLGLAQPTPPTPPTPPTHAHPPHPPHTPKPPKPPKAPKVKFGGSGGGSVTIDLHGLDEMIDSQIENALEAIDNDKNMPPQVREKIKQRIQKVRQKTKHRIQNLDADDMEDLGEELGKMGEELGEEMEEFGKEMEKWGKEYEKEMEKWGKDWSKQHEKAMEKWGKDFAKQMQKKHGNFKGNFKVDVDDDDDDFDVDVPDFDDDSDYDDAVRDLGDLKLEQNQRAKIKQLRVDSDAKVAAAKRELERLEQHLEKQLENPGTPEAEIARSIDAVTQQEAAIRKARILAWVKARNVLDDAQRKKVEGAAKRRGP